jgi:uncharacterized protein YbcC (UPF0753/DUF2309 family)
MIMQKNQKSSQMRKKKMAALNLFYNSPSPANVILQKTKSKSSKYIAKNISRTMTLTLKLWVKKIIAAFFI